ADLRGPLHLTAKRPRAGRPSPGRAKPDEARQRRVSVEQRSEERTEDDDQGVALHRDTPWQKLARAAARADRRGMDWDAALAAFASYLEGGRAYSAKTVEVYLRDVQALREHLRGKRGGDAPLARLSALDVRGQLAALFGHNGAATLNRRLSSVRAFGRFLVKRGAIAGNPAAAI